MTKMRVRSATDVRRALRMVKRPVDSAAAEVMLQCYAEMSEAGQAGVERLVASVCNQFVLPFGEVQALELVGVLLERGFLRSWERD